MSKKITQFDVQLYGDLQPYNQVLSKCRCRIFYKYENRNGGFITDEFADKLVATLPYVPVKGIYDKFNDDYTGHGKNHDEGRIYGIVPESHNFAWEPHVDDDGVERIYACCDVLVFTALYQEASEIVSKSQSMELFAPSIKGGWKTIHGQRLFVYTDACFLGLQALGDDVKPCFEGAAFFTLYSNLQEAVDKLEQFALDNSTVDNGGQEMDKLNFKLSDSQKFDMLFSALNPEYNEEGNWSVAYSICSVYDEYAIAYDYENNRYVRVYYTKNDEDDSISLGEVVEVYIVDVTESEKKTLDTIQAINGGSFEKADEIYSKNEELTNQVSTLEGQVSELQTQVETFNSEKENFEQQIVELNNANATLQTENENSVAELSTLKEEVEQLRAFRLNAETAEKESILQKYSKSLPEETLKKYSESLEKFAIADLKKELAFEMVEHNPNLFNLETPAQYVPKEVHTGGIEDILSKYTNKMED